MSYITAAVNFFVKYDLILLPCAFLLVWIFGVINFCRNAYRRQNKQLNACRVRLLKGCPPNAVIIYAPAEYRRQWRAFVASGATRPAQTFEFVPLKKRKVGVLLLIVGALLSTVYLAIFVIGTLKREYLVFQFAFWLAFAIVLTVNRLICRRKEKRARQTFGKFVAQLNAVAKAPVKETVVEQIQSVKKTYVGNEAVEKASQILRNNGLNANRTAQEQRQINRALNGLLQAYSRHV